MLLGGYLSSQSMGARCISVDTSVYWYVLLASMLAHFLYIPSCLKLSSQVSGLELRLLLPGLGSKYVGYYTTYVVSYSVTNSTSVTYPTFFR